MSHVLALPNGTVLASDYRIERVLGAGGFGITYLADEMALQRRVTIKEYFPADYAARGEDMAAVPRSEASRGDYQWGLERFIEEAQTLARFDHRHIVKVYRYFRANNTGYMVLQFEEGGSFKAWLKGLGRAVRQPELDGIVAPLLDALETIHNADFLHRDIAPDNIMVRRDGSPVLIDFGSARGEIAQHSRTLSALVKPGYSPYEQYSETGHRQGPWTDIYALGATLYHAISGKRPPDAPSRVVKDEYVPAREVALSSYRSTFLRAIDRALVLEPERRPQSVAAWRGDLLAPEPAPARVGFLRRAVASAEPAVAEVAPGSLAEALARGHPLVPDAPGPQGGFLDYVDVLKRKDQPAEPPPPLRIPEPPPAPEPAPQPAATPPSTPPSSRTPKAKADALPVPVTPPSGGRSKKPPRPRPVRKLGARTWRPLLVKLAIGLVLATVVVMYQDRLPFPHAPAPPPSKAPAAPAAAVRTGSTASVQQAAAAPETLLLGQLAGHRGGTIALDYSDDGRILVSAGADGTLKVWAAANGALQRTIDVGPSRVTSLALTGRTAATGHADGRIAVWDLDRGERVALMRRNEASIWSLSFAGSPTRLLASSHDWSVSLWNTAQPVAPMHVFEGHESAAQAVAFSPRSSFVASGAADKTVRLWNAASLSHVRTYRGHKDFVTAVAFAPDGRVLASAALDGTVRLWSTASSRHMRTLNAHRGRISGLAFSPTGELLATGGDDGAVRIWDFKRGRSLRTYGGGGPGIRALAFSADGTRLAVAGDEGSIRLWSASVPLGRRGSSEEE